MRLYLIRHCQAAGQAMEAELTEAGRRQAERLAELLAETDIGRIVSSPMRRACQSAEPLAYRLGLPVEVEPRLIERVLCAVDRPDWLEQLRAGFDDLDRCLPGGESSREATARGAAVLDALRADGRTAAVVTHGNLLTLMLRHLDGTADFATWQALTNPDAFQIDITEHTARIERLWRVE